MNRVNRYFKGWYFKSQNKTQTVAVIPAIHIDEKGQKSASIQVITDAGVWNTTFSYEQFSCRQKKLQVVIGENLFSEHGLTLNLKTDQLTACGSLKFGPLAPICYDIMGPFRFVPFMECRHSVFSMAHTVTGSLCINGQEYVFERDTGYIEGDRGRSFPEAYAWTQYNFFDESPCSLMLSVAKIPLGALRFTGIAGVILWRGKEYRIATYLCAKATHIGNREISVSQGRFKLTATLLKGQDHPLYAPVLGGMKRFIRESVSCTVHYSFEENGKTLFDFTTDRASFEYEYDK